MAASNEYGDCGALWETSPATALVGDLEDRGLGGPRRGGGPGLLTLADFREDLVVIGEAAGGPVRIGGLAVDGDLEDPAVPLLEVGSDPEFLLDGGLQTGGLGKVVSLPAIQDLDRHRLPPSKFL